MPRPRKDNSTLPLPFSAEGERDDSPPGNTAPRWRAADLQHDRAEFAGRINELTVDDERNLTLFDQEPPKEKPQELLDFIQSLPPYERWAPSESTINEAVLPETVEQWILEMLEVEGPVRGRRLLHVVESYIGGSRQHARDRVLKCITAIVKRGDLLQDNETAEPAVLANNYLRLRGAKRIRPRGRGPRQLAEIPPSEAKWLLLKLSALPQLSTHAAKVALADIYRTEIDDEDFATLYNRAIEMIDEDGDV